MPEAEQIVRKGEFAALRNVSAGRVSQWIAEGKIGPEALIGDGRYARIRVAIANEHLRERLDPSQRFGLNGIATRLDEPLAASVHAAPLPEHLAPQRSFQLPPAPPPVDTVEARIKAEKLRQAELTTRRAEEQDRLSRGVYVNAKDARDEMTRIAARLLDAIDGAMPDFAAAFAAQFKIPARDSLHLLRKVERKFRERLAAEYGFLAEAEPVTLADEANYDEVRS